MFFSWLLFVLYYYSIDFSIVYNVAKAFSAICLNLLIIFVQYAIAIKNKQIKLLFIIKNHPELFLRSERFLVNPVIVQLYPYMSAIIIYLLQLFLYHALLSVERIIDTWNYYKRKDGSVYETSYYCDCHRLYHI